MIKVIAKIKLYKTDTGRKFPFRSGYRPAFDFIPDMKTSGSIVLLNKEEFAPGEEDIVEISFIDRELLGKDFGKGSKFTFSEGRTPLGEGEIIEIIT